MIRSAVAGVDQRRIYNTNTFLSFRLTISKCILERLTLFHNLQMKRQKSEVFILCQMRYLMLFPPKDMSLSPLCHYAYLTHISIPEMLFTICTDV